MTQLTKRFAGETWGYKWWARNSQLSVRFLLRLPSDNESHDYCQDDDDQIIPRSIGKHNQRAGIFWDSIPRFGECRRSNQASGIGIHNLQYQAPVRLIMVQVMSWLLVSTQENPLDLGMMVKYGTD
jgi:hypothetical protein